MELEIPVSDLARATSFYLAALDSLGYAYKTKENHAIGNSTYLCVAIGPRNSNFRTWLYECDKGSKGSRGHHRRVPHIIFPATSRVAVGSFYAAALNAGGRSVFPPGFRDDWPALYTAVVQDVDGNKVEVSYECSVAPNPTTPASLPIREPIRNGRERFTQPPSRAEIQGTPRPRDVPHDSVHSDHASVVSVKRATSAKGSETDNSKGKGVVGTLLGAAAGAAVVYAITKETADSKDKEAKFNSRNDNHDRLRDEARQRAYGLAWKEKAAKSGRDRRGGSQIERDSGYYSGGSQMYDKSPNVALYRSNTNPRPSTNPRSGRRSSLSDRDYRVSSAGNPSRFSEVPRDPSPRSTTTYTPRDRSPSNISRQQTHVTVSKPPSEVRRVSPPLRRTSPPPRRQSPPSRRQSPPARRAPLREPSPYSSRPERPPPRTTRTVRYIPVSAPKASERATPRADPRPRPSYDNDRADDSPDYLDPYEDLGDGLDDETVVPDDSISVVSSNAPSHKVDPRPPRRDRTSNEAPPRRRGRVDVAAY